MTARITTRKTSQESIDNQLVTIFKATQKHSFTHLSSINMANTDSLTGDLPGSLKLKGSVNYISWTGDIKTLL